MELLHSTSLVDIFSVLSSCISKNLTFPPTFNSPHWWNNFFRIQLSIKISALYSSVKQSSSLDIMSVTFSCPLQCLPYTATFNNLPGAYLFRFITLSITIFSLSSHILVDIFYELACCLSHSTLFGGYLLRTSVLSITFHPLWWISFTFFKVVPFLLIQRISLQIQFSDYHNPITSLSF